MNKPTQYSFQLFTLSKDESNCPHIPELIHLGVTFYQSIPQTDKIKLIMSTSYGKRIVINITDTPINRLVRSDFIEIVDFDPIRNILLIIGSKLPHEITPLHWIIHHAKPEISILVMILDETNSLQFSSATSQTVSSGKTLFDTAKTVLRALQKNPILIIENKGLLITGNSFEKVKETLYQCVENKQ